jgi:hypothetical protein
MNGFLNLPTAHKPAIRLGRRLVFTGGSGWTALSGIHNMRDSVDALDNHKAFALIHLSKVVSAVKQCRYSQRRVDQRCGRRSH